MWTVVLLSLWNLWGGQVFQPAAAAPGGEKSQLTRCADLYETPDERVKPTLKIPPGAPPLLSFRYFEGRMRQRFSGVDLMLDDAGH